MTHSTTTRIQTTTQEDLNIQKITKGKKSRRSDSPKKKPTKYRQSETVITDDSTDDSLWSSPRKSLTTIAKLQPTNAAQYDDMPSHEGDQQPIPAQPARNPDEEALAPQAQSVHNSDEDVPPPQQIEAERELDPNEL